MTCIVALEHKGKVYMGGDSAAVAGWDIQRVTSPKVFRVGDFLMGYTSSFRMGQLLQYNLEIPDNTDGDNDMRYLVASFIPAVRDCLKKGGYIQIENNREGGGFFLVGYRGKAYKVADDFQIIKIASKFIAVGSGDNYAIGALAARKVGNPEKAVLRALEIAGTYSAAVSPPYYVISA